MTHNCFNEEQIGLKHLKVSYLRVKEKQCNYTGWEQRHATLSYNLNRSIFRIQDQNILN